MKRFHRPGPALRLLAVTVLVLSGASAGRSAHAAAITPEAALVRVLTVTPIQAAWFAPSFLTQINVNQVEQGIAQVKAAYGTYQGVDPLPGGTYRVRLQYGSATIQIHLDATHHIDGLAFVSLQFAPLSRSAAMTALQQLPGRMSLLVLANGYTQIAINAGRGLAVGSAFKLAVMAALQQQIAAHRLSWIQKITLLASDKSLPSGVLQTNVTGSTYAISDVARLMISISDNTAANMLIRVVGRAAIDALIPTADQPMLTTREAFILKDPTKSALRDRYLAAKTPAARLKLLPEVDKLSLPPVTVFTGSMPVSPEIEWFFSSKQLCTLIGTVAPLPQMSLNPGVATPGEWQHVAYKGGSEVGVINLTTAATSKSGTHYCVSATWNDTAKLDEPHFTMLYANILNSFR